MQSYDKDGDGFVSFAELKRGLLESGYDMSFEAVRDLMSTAGANMITCAAEFRFVHCSTLHMH